MSHHCIERFDIQTDKIIESPVKLKIHFLKNWVQINFSKNIKTFLSWEKKLFINNDIICYEDIYTEMMMRYDRKVLPHP